MLLKKGLLNTMIKTIFAVSLLLTSCDSMVIKNDKNLMKEVFIKCLEKTLETSERSGCKNADDVVTQCLISADSISRIN